MGAASAATVAKLMMAAAAMDAKKIRPMIILLFPAFEYV